MSVSSGTDIDGSARESVPLRFRWERAVMADESTLSPTARLLGLVLATYGNKHGTSIYPSVGVLASKMGVESERTVYRARRELIDAGVLEEVGRHGGIPEYRLVMPVASAAPDTSVTPTLTLVSPNQTSDQTSTEEEHFWSVIDELVGEVDTGAVVVVNRSRKVAAKIVEAVRLGKCPADFRRCWTEQELTGFERSAPGVALKVLDRVITGKKLPSKRRKDPRGNIRSLAPLHRSRFDMYPPGLHDSWEVLSAEVSA